MSDNIVHARGFRDLKIYELLTNSAGSAPSYSGTGIDVPSVQDFDPSPEYKGDKLKGDDEVKDTYSVLESYTLKIKHGQMSLQAEALITGATIIADGDGNAAIVHSADDEPGEFGIDLLADKAGPKGEVAGLRVCYYACRLKDGKTESFKQDAYGDYELTLDAIPVAYVDQPLTYSKHLLTEANLVHDLDGEAFPPLGVFS